MEASLQAACCRGQGSGHSAPTWLGLGAAASHRHQHSQKRQGSCGLGYGSGELIPHMDALLRRNENECKKRRRTEVPMDSLLAGSFVAHPEFMLCSGGSERACDDCTISEWNPTTVSEEKLILPTSDDPVDYASRLLEADGAAEPQVAVADEDSAYRNWATGRPETMMMFVLTGRGRGRVF